MLPPLKPALIFECVGVPGIIQQLFEAAPRDARIVVVGVCMETDCSEPMLGIMKELNVQYVLGYTPDEFAASLRLIAEGEDLASVKPTSFSPDVADSLVSHRGVDNGVRNRAMAHECLQRSCIDSTSRQGVASSVPQHVSVDREWQLGDLAKPLYQLLRAVDG
jgi:hypothetical protein